jgi:hypothetical protein
MGTNCFRTAGVSPAGAWATCPDESGSCPRTGRKRDASGTAGKMPAVRGVRQSPKRGAKLLILSGLKSALDELSKTEGQDKKDVKNEGCSQWLIENKGPKKVLPMSS